MYRIRPWLATSGFHTLIEGDDSILALYRPVDAPGVSQVFVPLEDGYPITRQSFDEALGFINAEKTAGRGVLIVCGSGISRSTTMAVAALRQIEGVPLDTAFWQIRAVHPHAMPDEIHWKSLCDYFDEDIPFWDMWREAEL